MKKIFNQIQIRKPKRNKFDLSHEKKLSMQMGNLVPIFWRKTMPGDSFKINTEIFMRLAPMLAPVMHRVNVETFWFKVPMRLLWNEWESFITGGVEGDELPTEPWMSADELKKHDLAELGSLADYFGVPVQNLTPIVGAPGQDVSISALPFRAYQICVQEYFNDQTLTPTININKNGGEMTWLSGHMTEHATIRKSSWEKDYFTSALPWPQRGPEMLMPIEFRVDTAVNQITGTPLGTAGDVLHDNTGQLYSSVGPQDINLIGDNVSASINELRTAIKIQQWLEANARGGARYIEQILHHFGVISSDARLQRPEYLGGSRQPVKISEVLSTVEATEPQGNMAGHGLSAGNGRTISTYCEEHCIILGIMRVLPRTAYFDGVDRDLMWKANKFEYPWPELAHLGEQEISTYELYYANAMTPGTAAEQIFGYQSRYAEWKQAHDTVHGDFRTTLDYWHMARKMPDTLTEIALNGDFIQADPTQRIFAVTDEEIHKLYVQIFHHVSALRPLPYFGTPSFT